MKTVPIKPIQGSTDAQISATTGSAASSADVAAANREAAVDDAIKFSVSSTQARNNSLDNPSAVLHSLLDGLRSSDGSAAAQAHGLDPARAFSLLDDGDE